MTGFGLDGGELVNVLLAIVNVLLVSLIGFASWYMRTTVNEVKTQIEKLGDEIRKLEKEHGADQAMLHQHFLPREDHYLFVGKIEGMFKQVFEQNRSLAAELNQIIGKIDLARELKGG